MQFLQRQRHRGNSNGTKSARNKFFYFDDDGLLVCHAAGRLQVRVRGAAQQGTMGIWAEPFTTLRVQKIFNLMQDPFERADITSNTLLGLAAQSCRTASTASMDEVFQFVETFKEFPPRSFPPSFNPANILEARSKASSENRR